MPDNPRSLPSERRVCEACGVEADDLIEHQGAYWCPTLHRCDYNSNIGWINADIQAGIAAAERERLSDAF